MLTSVDHPAFNALEMHTRTLFVCSSVYHSINNALTIWLWLTGYYARLQQQGRCQHKECPRNNWLIPKSCKLTPNTFKPTSYQGEWMGFIEEAEGIQPDAGDLSEVPSNGRLEDY